MKIAVTAEEQNGLESRVAQHFGHSPFFAFIEVDGKEVKSIEIIANPFISGHAHGQVPTFINENNANVMISGGMGRGAINFFESFGIDTATGASGTIQQTLERYFNGELTEAEPCQHHDDHHGSGHGHHH
jgi:predicted Fe-Mo cluster-binding NifX family protein